MATIELALITCEHGGNDVPKRYAAWFRDHRGLLNSHRAYDRGALEVARRLSSALEVPLLASTTTRLLVDLNRSEHHRALFSEITRAFDSSTQQRLLAEYYRPHRDSVDATLRQRQRRRAAQLHVAAHSFVPIWKGVRRDCDVGLLYDPRRPLEARFTRAWRVALQQSQPRLQVRLNRPYRGWTDGLTTALRAQYSATRYLGIELEINQRLVRSGSGGWKALQDALVASLRQALNENIR